MTELAKAIGFDVVDAGPLQSARWLETLGYFNIQLGYAVGLGPAIGFKLVHEKSASSGRQPSPQTQKAQNAR